MRAGEMFSFFIARFVFYMLYFFNFVLYISWQMQTHTVWRGVSNKWINQRQGKQVTTWVIYSSALKGLTVLKKYYDNKATLSQQNVGLKDGIKIASFSL